ncbi:anti-sigma factor [Catenuloplanes japonicus]|uniref:anti-sigma factor n=1 Tax=Catenuloplanes japonicus TaxID=33876 RepID=UPI000527ECA1|nr:anti-sigma factor [Catenuloplanes japonicus]
MTMDIHALVGAYVLDAVDDIERAAFDRHLGTCKACSAEVDELRETTARLADATWSVPPPSLRRDVLTRIAVTRQSTPRRVAPARRRVPWGRRLLAVAAAVALAAGTGAAAYVYQDQRLQEQQLALAEAARIQAVLTAPDAKLRTEDVIGGGHVTVVVSASQDAGVVMLAEGLPPGAAEAYQLWTIRGTTPTPAGVMPAGQGAGTKFITSVRDTDVLALTIEPASGSAKPTLPIKAQVPLEL